MHYMVFASFKGEQRPIDAFVAYLNDRDGHPDVILHHAGPTLDDDGETINGLLLVIEASSLGAARTFVDESPHGRTGALEETVVRPWNWMTGRPG